MMETFTNDMILDTESSSIQKVEKYIDNICSKYNVNNDYYGNILIALTEAVNNAMCHGNGMDPLKKVKLSYKTEKDELDFFVEDEGPGFNYDSLPDPTDPENIDKPNGRGVFLMKHLADEVNFHNEGKIIELKFNLN